MTQLWSTSFVGNYPRAAGLYASTLSGSHVNFLRLCRILVHATEGGESTVSEQGFPEDLEDRPAVGTPPQTWSLTIDDLAAAVPSNRAHLPLVIAGREWRKVLRHLCTLEHFIPVCTFHSVILQACMLVQSH